MLKKLSRRLRSPWTWLIAIIGIEVLIAIGWWVQRQVRAPNIGPVERGRVIAVRNGCFACHGPGGNGGVFNPGSDIGEVPAWSGRTLMMYAKNQDEIRDWILEGAPKRLRGSAEYLQEREKAIIHMPAYKDRLTNNELEDLIIYVKAVSWFDDPPSELAIRGRDIALENGCFGCHGPSGHGRVPNPGSFKGYIPSWDGEDFEELVKNDNELDEWILDGMSKRFKADPGAQIFLKRQVIKMPPYRDRITDEELNALKTYIKWIQK